MLTAMVRAAEELRELPIDPLWVGVITLGVLLAMMWALLAFGRGRPHT
ncbi:MAG: hypothetical protein K0Q93_621 [Nocardioidaceae bacterium]|jgi:hypothetical protein|nr:hypothetical protein [Nocardioidaceae bacterium]